MPQEIIAIAIFSPMAGRGEECLALTRELIAYIHSQGYGRDLLLRDSKSPNTYMDIRWWASEAVAKQAHADPEIHKF